MAEEPKVPGSDQGDQPKVIQMTEAQINELLGSKNKEVQDAMAAVALLSQEVSALREQVNGPTTEVSMLDQEVKEHNIKVCYFKGKLVTGFKNISMMPGQKKYFEKDVDNEDPTKQAEYVYIILEGDEEKAERVKLTFFMQNADRIETKLLKREQVKTPVIAGMIEKKEIEEGSKGHIIEKSMGSVANRVVLLHEMFEVSDINGKIFMIQSQVANI